MNIISKTMARVALCGVMIGMAIQVWGDPLCETIAMMGAIKTDCDRWSQICANSMAGTTQQTCPIYDGGEGARDRAELFRIMQNNAAACRYAQQVVEHSQRNQQMMRRLNAYFDNELEQIQRGVLPDATLAQWAAEAVNWSNTKSALLANGDGEIAQLVARRSKERVVALWTFVNNTLLRYGVRQSVSQMRDFCEFCNLIARAYDA